MVMDNYLGVMGAIYQRRSVRSYTEEPVTETVVFKLLHAAVQAPSGLNKQPWGFGVFHGRNRLWEYSDRAKRHLVATYPVTFEPHSRADLYAAPGYDLFHGAGTLIVIYATQGKMHSAEDCCLAAQNLMLAAHALGLGTCAVGFAREWFDLPSTKRDLEVPEHYSAVMPITVGYPATVSLPPGREEPNVLSWKWDAR